MNKSKLIRPAACLLGAWLGCAAATPTLAANQAATDDANNAASLAEPSRRWPVAVSVDYTYVAGGDVSFQGATGRSTAQSVGGRVGAEIPVDAQWFVPVRVSTRNLFLGTVADAPIPDQIHTAGLDVGLGCHLNEQWTIEGAVGPRFYRLDGIETADLGFGGTIRATYKCDANLTLVFGINFETERQVPVLPVGGLRWNIQTNLTLNLLLPRPALIYRLEKRFDLFVAGGGEFTVFRTDSNLGNTIGQPVFNNALGTYRDFHVGGGVDYHPWRRLSLGVEGGYSFGREIDYKNIGQTLSFGNSPYIQARLRCQF